MTNTTPGPAPRGGHCPACQGLRRTPTGPCATCDGTGRVTADQAQAYRDARFATGRLTARPATAPAFHGHRTGGTITDRAAARDARRDN